MIFAEIWDDSQYTPFPFPTTKILGKSVPNGPLKIRNTQELKLRDCPERKDQVGRGHLILQTVLT